MTMEEIMVAAVASLVTMLPEDYQKKIKACSDDLINVLKFYGPDIAPMALALIGSSFAAVGSKIMDQDGDSENHVKN